MREEAARNLCPGGKVRVRQKVGRFPAGLTNRKDEVKQPCRTVLQSRAGRLVQHSQSVSGHTQDALPTLALVQVKTPPAGCVSSRVRGSGP